MHFCLPEVFFSRLDALEAANMDANQFVHLLGGKVQMLMQNATQLVQSAIVGQKKMPISHTWQKFNCLWYTLEIPTLVCIYWFIIPLIISSAVWSLLRPHY